uniref:Uncharacterized protein n=1 Tax=Physcomitrium patens TaxID=3218 RepID=A0A2K1LAG3_PHYPA|nr:hypothetical protein PHYPA_001441 [Physcomitrium patens]
MRASAILPLNTPQQKNHDRSCSLLKSKQSLALNTIEGIQYVAKLLSGLKFIQESLYYLKLQSGMTHQTTHSPTQKPCMHATIHQEPRRAKIPLGHHYNPASQDTEREREREEPDPLTEFHKRNASANKTPGKTRCRQNIMRDEGMECASSLTCSEGGMALAISSSSVHPCCIRVFILGHSFIWLRSSVPD